MFYDKYIIGQYFVGDMGLIVFSFPQNLPEPIDEEITNELTFPLDLEFFETDGTNLVMLTKFTHNGEDLGIAVFKNVIPKLKNNEH